jgi:hypothetical protein
MSTVFLAFIVECFEGKSFIGAYESMEIAKNSMAIKAQINSQLSSVNSTTGVWKTSGSNSNATMQLSLTRQLIINCELVRSN